MSSHLPAQVRGISGPWLVRFNACPAEAAEELLRHCCASPRWAHRVAAHRPYPDLDALLAAASEASYDLSPQELAGALAAEDPSDLDHRAPYAAQLALHAAHAEYERLFGHAFVICLAGVPPQEHTDAVLSGIQSRLGNSPEEERAVAADELRRLAGARLARLVELSVAPGAEKGADPSGAPELVRFAPVG
ncbi:2-oxo-4-hydroxy-4-carboxy-5-ureidoimidazoline decarboxylase [Streptomyces sp. WAC06614]|nr:2-oxo-4-hydroxy-4-carboxy-5-ureidoimidazoline decarboxylase [Streptomyces sp. WAC06614]